MTPTREEILKQLARDAGFSLAGIASLSPDPHANGRFADWLAAGMHGDMDYLRRHRPLREDATTLLPDARSAICVALNYYQPQEREQRDMDGSDNRGRFSIYAQSQDYHAVMDGMLADLDRRVRDAFPQAATLACCDTRPVSDRSLAMRAGIAWLGKNTNVISPQFGSWIFLGELLTTLELTPDAPLETLCGKCTRCIDACPTGALDTPFVLDARRCISYLGDGQEDHVVERGRDHRGQRPHDAALARAAGEIRLRGLGRSPQRQAQRQASAAGDGGDRAAAVSADLLRPEHQALSREAAPAARHRAQLYLGAESLAGSGAGGQAPQARQASAAA
jgi:ferredoxin